MPLLFFWLLTMDFHKHVKTGAWWVLSDQWSNSEQITQRFPQVQSVSKDLALMKFDVLFQLNSIKWTFPLEMLISAFKTFDKKRNPPKNKKVRIIFLEVHSIFLNPTQFAFCSPLSNKQVIKNDFPVDQNTNKQ